MKQVFFVLLAGIVLAGIGGCKADKTSARGFRLPDGSSELGQMVFLSKGCNGCHTISNVALPEPTTPGPVSVTLGGKVTKIKTYGELVSSIINPSHKLISNYPEEQVSVDGRSLMPDFNTQLSVQELIDLVAFISDQYEVVIPEYNYRTYHYGQ